ncbi:MAG TPA: flavin reductase family protein [Tepidisphaeraceae bacterium]|nr:flavin reductase family protein [Tepidisphaeraceae bacterium]
MPIAEHMKQVLGRPIGRIPSGVYILTAASGDHHMAMLASWVQQASFDPPCLSIAVAKDRPILEVIRESGRVALSILPEKDTTLMKKYARGFAPGEDAFGGITIVTTPGGLRAVDAALGWLECKITKECDFGGDHLIVMAEVTAAAMLREGQPFVHVRGSGFHY